MISIDNLHPSTILLLRRGVHREAQERRKRCKRINYTTTPQKMRYTNFKNMRNKNKSRNEDLWRVMLL